MASPTIGGGNPKMPSQPGGRPELVVDPIIPGGGRIQRPRLPGKGRIQRPRLPKPKPSPIFDTFPTPFPGPQPYAPIKQTKAVNTVYKTY